MSEKLQRAIALAHALSEAIDNAIVLCDATSEAERTADQALSDFYDLVFHAPLCPEELAEACDTFLATHGSAS